MTVIEYARLMLLLSIVLPSGTAVAADVPTFRSGEYEVTTTFGDSQSVSKKVCLTAYEDWFASLREKISQRGCELLGEGQKDAVYRYRMECSNGSSGTLAVTKVNDSNFESVSTINLSFGGFVQSISTRDRAKRLGDCRSE